MVFILLRLAFISLIVGVCRNIGYDLGNPTIAMIVGFVLGVIVVLVEIFTKDMSLRGLTSAVFGAILGLVTAKLVHDVMVAIQVDPQFIKVSYPVFTFIFVYFGLAFSLKKKDEFALILPYIRFTRSDKDETPILLDTSVIIDGRIFSVMKTGFISGRLIIPGFVLKEIQLLADSQDHNKRQKGRRALEILNAIKKDKNISVDIYEENLPQYSQVDMKLLHLAKILGAEIATLDYNLAKVAELEGIKVLNLNELITSLQPQLSAGDSFSVRLVREGKEQNQAVGYTQEGTMVVVENSRHLIGRIVQVEVYNVIQTQTGRIIFARLKNSKPVSKNNNHRQ